MKTLIFVVALMFSHIIMAQQDVTKFLGIPITGTKAEMEKKLIAKGFTPTKMDGQDFLKGEFNGTDSWIKIVTNNNKVFRIAVSDATNQNEADIKNRFNRLVSQFENNERYICFDNFTISDKEDISYEMLVNNKLYEACFYQVPSDTAAFKEQMHKTIFSGFSKEQLSNPTEDVLNEVHERSRLFATNVIVKRSVWFTIIQARLNEYYIAIYYDNEYNHANGEDL